MVPWYRSYLIPFGLAIIAFLIITTGGWIRINDAGESCPDWPTCFGTWGFDVSADEQEEWWNENPDEIDLGVGLTDTLLTKFLLSGRIGHW